MTKYTLKLGSEFSSAPMKSVQPTRNHISLVKEVIKYPQFFEVELEGHKYPVGTKMVLWINESLYSVCTTKAENLVKID